MSTPPPPPPPFITLSSLLPHPHLKPALQQSVTPTRNLSTTLFETHCLPTGAHAFSPAQVRLLLHSLSLLDTNNFGKNIGVGEREGRVACSEIVSQRHFGLAHGIGRSGDIGADQPKAAGSSVIARITRGLAANTLRLAGCRSVPLKGGCLVVPMCTGMTLALTLRTVAWRQRESKPAAKFVVWPRIDQKTSLKCIVTAGFVPEVVPMSICQGVVTTNCAAVEEAIQRLGPENVVCVLSTSSCFAPRVPDDVDGIAEICHRLGVGHVVNNAFGAQSISIMSMLDRVLRRNGKDRRLDVFVQSTDKNFRVPVGGAVVASSDPVIVDDVSKMYAGRGSMSPLLDLFVTLLQTTQQEYKSALVERRALMKNVFLPKARALASEFGETILGTFPKNPISFAMTLDSLEHPRALGGKLFYRAVSGPRVFEKNSGLTKEIVGLTFSDYGSHVDGYPHSYLVMSCAIGIDEAMIEEFLKRLKRAFRECLKEERRAARRKQKQEEEEHEQEGEG